MPKYKSKKNAAHYTVYDNKTDFPVVVSGTAEEGAVAMGVKLNTFHHAINGRRVNGKRWYVIKEADNEQREAD